MFTTRSRNFPRLAVKFEAESPDEAALVTAASEYGYILKSRSSDTYVARGGCPALVCLVTSRLTY